MIRNVLAEIQGNLSENEREHPPDFDVLVILWHGDYQIRIPGPKKHKTHQSSMGFMCQNSEVMSALIRVFHDGTFSSLLGCF